MHELFTKVLAKRDLSRAGDLFSVPDADIVNDITEVVSKARAPLLLPLPRLTQSLLYSSLKSIRSSRTPTT